MQINILASPCFSVGIVNGSSLIISLVFNKYNIVMPVIINPQIAIIIPEIINKNIKRYLPDLKHK